MGADKYAPYYYTLAVESLHKAREEAAFADYYRTTILSEETDPDKLHDLQTELDGYQVYAQEPVDHLAVAHGITANGISHPAVPSARTGNREEARSAFCSFSCCSAM